MALVKTFIASASELQSSDLYMTVKATLFTVPDANLNGVRCTHEFMSEIVEHQEKYIGLPLCADVKNLAQGRYDKLGHCYNALTGTFLTSMIGSFYKFEIVAGENDTEALIGYARILKRNKAVCKAISELFAEGSLKFSFEISCGSYEELEDKTILIDKADNNYLEGMCVVSFPACPDAVALQLVAEIEACNKDLEKEAEQMPIEETVVAEETVTKVEPQEEPVVETAEEAKEEPEKEEPEVETAEEIKEEPEVEPEENKETAEVVVTETHVEVDKSTAYDTETGDEVHEENIHEVTTYTTVAEEEKPDPIASLNEVIAELRRELSEVRSDISDVRKMFAEHEEKLVSGINPFMAEINQPKKYSLLDEEETPDRQHYSLLD